MFTKSTKVLVAALVLAGTSLALVANASARVNHQRNADPTQQSGINSGWGPPMNWNEIEISHPEGGG
jgi:hypothetical protein